MSDKLNIVAGFHSLEGYVRLAQAGADECFCGFVPHEWYRDYGSLIPANRREVLFYPVQLGSLSEMKILAWMAEEYGVPVSVTYNALSYPPGQYPVIEAQIRRLLELGFDRFILADPGLILHLHERNLPCKLHLSGEWGQLNSPTLRLLEPLHLARYIFPRQTSLATMVSCIRNAPSGTEFEGFLLNEKCHFSGGYCNCLHCDELPPLCQVPYELGRRKAGSPPPPELTGMEPWEGPGESGCGLCALPALRAAGITHLKIVGRGGRIGDMERDVALVKRALTLLEEPDFPEAVRELLGGRCSRNCYYL